MQAQIINGDITAIEQLPCFNPNALNSISQCCNCRGSAGRGLALSLRKKYPQAFEDYKQLCEQYKDTPKSLLGTVQVVMVQDNIAVCNMFGQLEYGTQHRQLNYEALYLGLEYQANAAKNDPNMEFYYPYKMGSDLAGGNWEIVLGMINALFKDLSNKVYIVRLVQ